MEKNYLSGGPCNNCREKIRKGVDPNPFHVHSKHGWGEPITWGKNNKNHNWDDFLDESVVWKKRNNKNENTKTHFCSCSQNNVDLHNEMIHNAELRRIKHKLEKEVKSKYEKIQQLDDELKRLDLDHNNLITLHEELNHRYDIVLDENFALKQRIYQLQLQPTHLETKDEKNDRTEKNIINKIKNTLSFVSKPPTKDENNEETPILTTVVYLDQH